MPDDFRQDWEEVQEIRKYIHQTGNPPPPGWRPGDPIPEPDHWQSLPTEDWTK